MSSKEKWIADVENSLQGLKPAESDPYLFSKVLIRLQHAKEPMAPLKAVWLTAASFVLLALINLLVLGGLQSPKRPGGNDLQMLSRDMQLLNTNSVDYQP